MAKIAPSWIEISTFEAMSPVKSQGMPNENKMACGGDGKKFRQSFDNPENDGELWAPVHHIKIRW